MQSKTNLVAAVEQYVSEYFTLHMPAEFVYHDLEHTRDVVRACVEIAESYDLSEKDLEMLQIAAWFHDVGYEKGSKGHEERSCQQVVQYLSTVDYPEEDVKTICDCIRVTKMPQHPETLLQKILCDADMSHLGKNTYWDRCGRVRQEMLITKSIVMSEQEWVDFELRFMLKHKYHTPQAQALYNPLKERHIRQLGKQKMRLNPDVDLKAFKLSKKKKKKNKKNKNVGYFKDRSINSDQEINEVSLGRGVETMYRTTYRTHVNLSSIADNKANIMLSINAIIISIVVGTLVPKFEINTKLVIPTLTMLSTCLVAMIFAILSTRPKITEGVFTRTDIKNKKSNLLFFGNFYNMKLEDFEWGMMEMIKDSDFLYSSMTRDIYFLGIVLAKKYKYLRICYSVFMYGLIISVLVFAISFTF